MEFSIVYDENGNESIQNNTLNFAQTWNWSTLSENSVRVPNGNIYLDHTHKFTNNSPFINSIECKNLRKIDSILTHGYDIENVNLIMKVTSCSKEKAIESLIKHKMRIIDSISEIMKS